MNTPLQGTDLTAEMGHAALDVWEYIQSGRGHLVRCEEYAPKRLKSVHFKNEMGFFHRTDGPAQIEWHENGNLSVERYFVNGELHREDGPADQMWNAKGKAIRSDYVPVHVAPEADGLGRVFV